jgi:Intracellular proteinase inhibitor
MSMIALCALALSFAAVADSMHLEIVLPDSVRAGEPVPVTLRLTNTSQKRLTVYLQGRPIAFDLTVRRLDGTIVWRRLEGEVVSAILAVRQLEPGASLEFEEAWGQVSSTGEAVSPGDYRVTGALPTDAPEPLQTSPALLRIVP